MIPPPLSLRESAELASQVLDQVERAIVGKREQLTLTLTGILAGGHVLLEDVPGLGKTLTAKSFAAALGLEFARAQFTPDLLPSDLTGSQVYNQASGSFDFHPGPLFAQLLLADEINRTPPKTQAALLEAMQEKQVSIEGTTHLLPRPFHVLATANPVEAEGTYPLPEAQLDRFLLRLSFGYPEPDDEWAVVSRRLERKHDDVDIVPVLQPGQLEAIQAAVEDVHVSDAVGAYAVSLASATRVHQHVQLGASPRGSLALVQCAQARALIEGRGYVTSDDIKALAHPCLDHRVVVRPELWLQNILSSQVVDQVLEATAVPEATLEETR